MLYIHSPLSYQFNFKCPSFRNVCFLFFKNWMNEKKNVILDAKFKPWAIYENSNGMGWPNVLTTSLEPWSYFQLYGPNFAVLSNYTASKLQSGRLILGSKRNSYQLSQILLQSNFLAHFSLKLCCYLSKFTRRFLAHFSLRKITVHLCNCMHARSMIIQTTTELNSPQLPTVHLVCHACVSVNSHPHSLPSAHVSLSLYSPI